MAADKSSTFGVKQHDKALLAIMEIKSTHVTYTNELHTSSQKTSENTLLQRVFCILRVF